MTIAPRSFIFHMTRCYDRNPVLKGACLRPVSGSSLTVDLGRSGGCRLTCYPLCFPVQTFVAVIAVHFHDDPTVRSLPASGPRGALSLKLPVSSAPLIRRRRFSSISQRSHLAAAACPWYDSETALISCINLRYRTRSGIHVSRQI